MCGGAGSSTMFWTLFSKIEMLTSCCSFCNLPNIQLSPRPQDLIKVRAVDICQFLHWRVNCSSIQTVSAIETFATKWKLMYHVQTGHRVSEEVRLQMRNVCYSPTHPLSIHLTLDPSILSTISVSNSICGKNGQTNLYSTSTTCW